MDDAGEELARRVAGLEAQLRDASAEIGRLRMFEELVEHGPFITWVVEPDGKVKYVSANRQEFGFPPLPRPIGEVTLFESIPPHFDQSLRSALAEVAASPPPKALRLTLDGYATNGRWQGRDITLVNRVHEPGIDGLVVISAAAAPSTRHDQLAAYERLAISSAASNEQVWEWDVTTDRLIPSPLVGGRIAAGSSMEEFLKVVHEDDRQHLLGTLHAHLDDPEPFEYDWRLAVEGGYRWFHSVGRSVVDVEGHKRIIGRTADIHDRRVTELALRDSERRYRALFESTSTAVTVRDVETLRLLDCNDSALRLFGATTRDQLRDAGMPSDLAPERQSDGSLTREVVGDAVARARREGASRVEFIGRRITGDLFHGAYQISKIDLGSGRSVFQTHIEDVTAVHERYSRYEAALSTLTRIQVPRPEALPSAMKTICEIVSSTIDVARTSIWRLDDVGQTLICLDTFERPSGVHRAGMIVTAIDLPELFDPTLADPDVVAWDDIRADSRLTTFVETFILPAGMGGHVRVQVRSQGRRVGTLSCSHRPGARHWFADEKSFLATVANVISSLVGQVDAQVALARANEEALAASRGKTAFLATMSHELRSPLNGVIGMVDLLARTALDERQKRFTEVARASARNLLSVINDVLDFSKLEAGRLHIEAGELSVQEVVDDAACLFSLEAERLGIGLNCDVDIIPPVLGDAARLRQVLVNLVSNGVKFTTVGEVSIRVSCTDSPGSLVVVRAEVRDTGIGITPSDRERIFRPFEQLGPGAQRGGTGLGLAICRELVERMGGAMGVESQEGKGSTFWFSLGLERAASGMARSPSLFRPAGRMLVVSHRQSTGGVLIRALARRGVDADVVRTVDAALERLAERSYSVTVVVDEPGELSARALAGQMASDAGRRGTRVVVIESLTHPLDGEEVRTLQIAGHCPQPAWSGRLEVILANLLQPGPVLAEAPVPLGATVLVVDDSAVNAEVAREVLQAAGWRVDVAHDGATALGKVTRRAYDLVLLDCLMPGLDGYETARQIRAIEREGRLPGRTPLPLVALTASATAGDRERAFEAGMNAHVAKPFDAEKLLQVLSSQLLSARTAAASGARERPVRARPPVQTSLDLSGALARLGGDEAILVRAVNRFLALVAETWELVRAAVDRRSARDVHFAAHRLRGQAATFDAAALVQALEGLEAAAAGENWPSADTLAIAARRELDVLIEALRPGDTRSPLATQ